MVEKRRRLGKGLDALLSSTRLAENDTATDITAQPPATKEQDTPPPPPSEIPTTQGLPGPTAGSQPHHESPAGPRAEFVRHVPVRLIRANRHQPRTRWNEDALQELAESIRANGIIQPILVRPSGEGYELIAGERRWRAAMVAGLESVPAIIRTATEEETLEWALVENIHRADLTAIERARAYASYLKAFSLTQEEGARRLGENRATIANYMRLLELDDEIQQMVMSGELSMGHARALLGIRGELERLNFARTIVARGLSVREAERHIQHRREGATPAEPPSRPQRPPHIRELEEELTRSVGTRVSIRTSGKKGHRGRILIDFYSLEDFDRIREQLQR